MKTAEEAALITKVLAGHLGAFEQLVQPHERKSLIIATSMVKDSDDAKDVVQEAFINAFRYLHKFDQKAMFSTWLYRIVVNQSLKFLRKQEGTTKVSEGYFQSSDMATSNLGPQNLEQQERRSAIEQVLKRMKPKEALMLQMHYLLELSVQEIEESTGFSKSNIKVLLHRARQHFHELKDSDNG